MKELQDKSSDTAASDVSRKIGRCILLLQQYEIQLKSMIASHEITGYADDLETRRIKRKAKVGKKTLGQLVGDLTGSYLSIAENDSQDRTEEEISGLDPTRAHFQSRFSFEMQEDSYQRTKERLAQLVALRNELVHHFLERFNLSTESGRHDAERYLDEAYQAINDGFRELHHWAESMDKVRKELVAFMDTPEFHNLIVYGILPGQEVDWPFTTIIQQLLAAERECNESGWTSLARAIQFIQQGSPGLTPKKYGCRSWRHVIHESGLFEVQRRENPENTVRSVWYRSRSDGTKQR